MEIFIFSNKISFKHVPTYSTPMQSQNITPTPIKQKLIAPPETQEKNIYNQK